MKYYDKPVTYKRFSLEQSQFLHRRRQIMRITKAIEFIHNKKYVQHQPVRERNNKSTITDNVLTQCHITLQFQYKVFQWLDQSLPSPAASNRTYVSIVCVHVAKLCGT